ncbi:MAG TPA: VacJ family lipoprotein [Verrucomicrobiae bacterium]|jgi:ABC-type transporter lipoprotein component MlaA/pimeloyl-ACP methyl ester carboxylesterase|nr:VacJ family lipoprotein [Verrucomicrobiae bacterium]
MRLPILAAMGCLAIEFALAQPAASAATNTPPQAVSPDLAGDSIVLPEGFNDPIEPFNRDMWAVNKGFLTYAVRPFSTGYRHVVVKPVRTGIGRMGKNMTWPDRLVNNMLQGNWLGAGQETERCLCNTVLGLGGFFDVATKWGIPKNDADFGQTFRKWGWRPGFYLMLPIFGPSDERDGVGLVGDAAANPMFYFFPFEFISPFITANNFSDTVEGAVCFSQAEADPYSILQYGWSFGHELRKVDMSVIGDQDQASLETLQSVLFSSTNEEFTAWGKTRSVLIPTTGRKLPFTYWLQAGQAPVVYLVPGFGAHRLAGNELGLAELLYENGYSVVCISSTFHPEFMDRASTTDLPSYPPTDVSDLNVALTEIDRRLDRVYRHRLGTRALMGYSMGAFQSLFLAGQAATNANSSLKFERYVAIDLPVDLRYSVTNLDAFYRGPLAWPAAERTADIENTLMKVVALSEHPPKAGDVLPFNAIESRFLIALGLRLTLRDIIFDSQLRHNQGVLQHPLDKSRRRAAYDEILQYSFLDYINKFAIPYDMARGIDMADPEVEKRATNLRTYTSELQANRNIRIIANRNDILLSADDLAWIETTFDRSEVTLFDHGGHLGNLSQPAVQKAILDALGGLGERQTAQNSREP